MFPTMVKKASYIFVILSFFQIPVAFSQYFNTTQISMMMGHKQHSERSYYYSGTRTQMQVSPSVTMTHGAILDKHFAAGVGIGFELFDHKLFPLFVDVRRTFRENTISPFFAFKFGYAFSNLVKKHYDELQLDYEPYHVINAYLMNHGGLMLHPEMGVKIPLNENSDFLMTVAYRHQKTKSTVSQDFGPKNKWERKESMNRLSFGVAITFK